MHETQQISFAHFESQVLSESHRRLVILDISAEWCAPCKFILPILNKVVSEFDGKFLLATLDVDEGENMKIAGRYQVKGFPTLIAFTGAEEQERCHGNQSLQFIRNLISRNLF
jgi:thioredoxin 1